MLEVGDVQLLLQVPDLDVGVPSTSSEDQTVRVELNIFFIRNLLLAHELNSIESSVVLDMIRLFG